MALVATYGDTNAYNIKIYDLSGGGYYAVLNDAATPVFQRRGNASDTVTRVSGANGASYIDRFTSYVYDTPTSTLTLSGASNTNTSVTFTRTLTFKFVSAYVVEDVLTITTNAANGQIDFTNWNYYPSADKVWNIDNTNFGDATSGTTLGIGVQLTAGGAVYGCIAASNYDNKGNNYKRAVAASSGIACIWIPPNDASYITLTANVPLSVKQWFFKSTNTLYDFILQAQLAMAAAKGFTGDNFTKIMKVTAEVNRSIRNDKTTLHLLPSFNYPRMYTRDSFWHSFGISNADEQLAMTIWEGVQAGTGKFPTSINADGTTNVGNDDEGSLLHLIRGWYDEKKRGLTVSHSVLQLCVTWIATHVTNDEYRLVTSNPAIFQMWNDNFKFTINTYCGYHQGLYCVALKCALDLGLTGVTQGMIDNAITKYKALYKTGFINYSSDKAYVGPDVFIGEALNIFLFGNTLLPDGMVNDTLQLINDKCMAPGGAKIVCDSNGSYLATSNFNDASAQGDYQNGGSWFLYEYLGWWVGRYHKHDASSVRLAEKRVKEFIKEPLMHEYLQNVDLGNYLSETTIRHIYSWNVAALVFTASGRRPV